MRARRRVEAQEAEMGLMSVLGIQGKRAKAKSKGLSTEGRQAPYLKVQAQTL